MLKYITDWLNSVLTNESPVDTEVNTVRENKSVTELMQDNFVVDSLADQKITSNETQVEVEPVKTDCTNETSNSFSKDELFDKLNSELKEICEKLSIVYKSRDTKPVLVNRILGLA